MKQIQRKWLVPALGVLMIAVAGSPPAYAAQPLVSGDKGQEPAGRRMSLEWGREIPLTLQSSGVEWGGHTYHLVRLLAVEFRLEREASRLQARLQAGITSFDNVEYEISVAAFDAAGEFLGAGRTPLTVERLWVGRVLNTTRTFEVDLGASLDFERAAAFMVAISRRPVLTPEQWQSSK